MRPGREIRRVNTRGRGLSSVAAGVGKVMIDDGSPRGRRAAGIGDGGHGIGRPLDWWAGLLPFPKLLQLQFHARSRTPADL